MPFVYTNQVEKRKCILFVRTKNPDVPSRGKFFQMIIE